MLGHSLLGLLLYGLVAVALYVRYGTAFCDSFNGDAEAPSRLFQRAFFLLFCASWGALPLWMLLAWWRRERASKR